MDVTATGTIYQLLAEEYPEGCTGEQAQEFMRRAGHSYGSASISLREMGSNLAGGPGCGVVKSSASRGQKMRTGKLRKGARK